MAEGWIKLDRSIFEHWIFQDAEKFRAFVDLIQLARWKDEKLLIGNEIVNIPRGSYYTSELKLAEKWGWSRKKTREYLKLLESEGMIIKKGTTKGTTITIENYRLYQDEGTTKGTSKEQQKNIKRTTKDTSKEHQKNNEGYTKEEREEIKEIKEIEEGKEGEENPPSLPPLSFPTPYHETIFNQWSESTYRTWFMDSDIEDKGNEIVMLVQTEFVKDVVNEKFKEYLDILLGKKVVVRLKE
ncbi:DnaA N-terminal domain-containing protein [Clostridium sp. UBA1353]|uniref:DnaA N-terminal domain-containing protein n=1 Tax=Clostridium sp. UBA1353 TaxID=1946347 RepID=UPI003216C965